MKKVLALLAPLIAAAAFLTAGSANAVVGGQVDGFRHPYVGLAVYYFGDRPVSECSGTLVSPTVFLTAAHCAFGPRGPNGNPLVATSAKIWFSPAVQSCPPAPFPCAGADATATAPDALQFSPGATTGFTDLGVIKLDQPVRNRGFAVLAPQGALDFLAARGLPRTLGIAGYGSTSPFDPQRTFGALKLLGIAPNIPAPPGYAMLSADPTQGAVACRGDSGGPILFGSAPVVFAVVSATDHAPGDNSPCPTGSLFAFRTDTPQALAFLAQFGIKPLRLGELGDGQQGEDNGDSQQGQQGEQ
jgi:hypothetical protein